MSSMLRSQLTFTCNAKCTEFRPNIFRKERCRNCSQLINEHDPKYVSDDHLKMALESLSKPPASLILSPSNCNKIKGNLYLGGFQSSSINFVKQEKITHIVNTAKDLHKFYVRWGREVKQLEDSKTVKFLHVGWLDSMEQLLYKHKKWDQLQEAIDFIVDALTNGGNVVVHCAQGKSRSATVVIACVMVLLEMNFEDALKFVQEKRSVAQPNPNFVKQLKEFEKDLRK